jgi:hypothetical protein
VLSLGILSGCANLSSSTSPAYDGEHGLDLVAAWPRCVFASLLFNFSSVSICGCMYGLRKINLITIWHRDASAPIISETIRDNSRNSRQNVFLSASIRSSLCGLQKTPTRLPVPRDQSYNVGKIRDNSRNSRQSLCFLSVSICVHLWLKIRENSRNSCQNLRVFAPSLFIFLSLSLPT